MDFAGFGFARMRVVYVTIPGKAIEIEIRILFDELSLVESSEDSGVSPVGGRLIQS